MTGEHLALAVAIAMVIGVAAIIWYGLKTDNL